MKAAIEVSLGLFSSVQTREPRADTWMFVLQYHLTSGIYVSKFQPQPRKCQREERGSMRKWGEGCIFNPGVGNLDDVKSKLYQMHREMHLVPNTQGNGCQKPEMSSPCFLRCCSHLCPKGNNVIKIWGFFSRNVLIKRTSWSKFRLFESTFNLLIDLGSGVWRTLGQCHVVHTLIVSTKGKLPIPSWDLWCMPLTEYL